MRTTYLPHRLAALTLAAVALIGLTGCTGPGAGNGDQSASGTDNGTQTTTEACEVVNDIMTEATAEFENMDPNDPDAVVEAMDAAVQSLSDASEQVSNEEVAAILPDLQAMFGQVADLMAAIVEGDTSKVGELEDLGASFKETGARFEELCAPSE
ncbi:hypothetical protein [Microbacterium flavescens]|jgi:hypothetical protein|uniref:hypothetical protein n=1 Tax=Microbacterium flavescens TaxID=69366 RepID=UPI001BDF1277|nr:hypothetical protein [Microbacterium flavescens]